MEMDIQCTHITAKPVRTGSRKQAKLRPLRLTVESLERKKKVIKATRT